MLLGGSELHQDTKRGSAVGQSRSVCRYLECTRITQTPAFCPGLRPKRSSRVALGACANLGFEREPESARTRANPGDWHAMFGSPRDSARRIMTSRAVVRSYFAITGVYTLSASLIWGVSTLFLLHAGL